MKHQLVTIAIVLAALFLYAMGAAMGTVLLCAGGAVLELWFWARVLSRRRGVAGGTHRAHLPRAV